MLMQRLLPAVREALDEAAVKPEEIDLIVGLALSPDHLIENRDIMAPKIGHPLQKVLGANRAHVFDLTDSSLARALYVVDTLASDQGYRNVLVVRGESSQGLEVDSESGFALADGALALLCRPTGKAAFRRGALGGDPAQEWLPLSIPLNTDIRQVGDVKGHLNLPAQPGLPGSGTRRIHPSGRGLPATELGARGMVRPGTARWSLPGAVRTGVATARGTARPSG